MPKRQLHFNLTKVTYLTTSLTKHTFSGHQCFLNEVFYSFSVITRFQDTCKLNDEEIFLSKDVVFLNYLLNLQFVRTIRIIH